MEMSGLIGFLKGKGNKLLGVINTVGSVLATTLSHKSLALVMTSVMKNCFNCELNFVMKIFEFAFYLLK